MLIDYLDQLQRYAEGQSGSLMVPSAANLANLTSLGNMGNLAPSDAGSAHGSIPSGADLSPAYTAARTEVPSITVKHMSKAAIGKREPWQLAFMPGPEPKVAVADFNATIEVFNPLIGARVNTHHMNGIHMCFHPNGTTIAMLTEQDREDIGRPNDAPIHDGVNFVKPLVVIWDTTSGRKLHLRWQGVKPLTFSPDGRRLAVTAPRGQIRLIDVSNVNSNVRATASPTGRGPQRSASGHAATRFCNAIAAER